VEDRSHREKLALPEGLGLKEQSVCAWDEAPRVPVEDRPRLRVRPIHKHRFNNFEIDR
jgi:hypothetical protein